MNDRNDWLTDEDEEARLIRLLTEKTDLSPNQARELMRSHRGVGETELLEKARRLKAEG